MFRTARFPVFVPAAVPSGKRNPKPTFLVLETMVEIEELSGDDAPVALTVTRQTSADDIVSTDFRYRDGRFYTTPRADPGDILPGQQAVRRFEEILSDPFDWQSPAASLSEKHAMRALEHKGVHPRGIALAVLGWQEFTVEHSDLLLASRRARVAEEHLADVELARQEFVDACAGFLFVDGEPWIECSQPVWTVDTLRDGRMGVHDYGFPVTAITGKALPGLATAVFPLSEEGEARTTSTLTNERAILHPPISAVVHMPGVLTDEVPLGDGIRLLHECLKSSYLPANVESRLSTFLSDGSLWSVDSVDAMAEHVLGSISPNARRMFVAVNLLRTRLADARISLDGIAVPAP